MPPLLFATWLERTVATAKGVDLFHERPRSRKAALAELKRLIADHFVGESTVLAMGGFKRAAATILNSLPTTKRIQSGDLAELIASEYVDAHTAFVVPIKKLRWKSDRQMPMHGNDVIAVDASSTPVRALKVESKSRAAFATAVVTEANETLDAHEGRPNPSTLAFITKRLYEEKRDAEAEVFRKLQGDGALKPTQIQHLIFALAGRDPTALLAAGSKPKRAGIKRSAAAVVVDDHADFIAAAFGTHGARPTRA
nr:Hachiman antiphage defense system protein HamA [Kofleriaceae bacterium]